MWRFSAILFVLLLAAWPLTHWYTSFGLDIERPDGPTVDCTYYRVRWPGDGSMMVGWIDEQHSAARKPASGWDFGGLFFQPPLALDYGSTWNRLGFWAVDYDHLRDAGQCPVSPRALRAKLIGFPYELLVIFAASGVGLQYFLARRKRMASPASA